MTKSMIQVDLTEFTAGARKHIGKDWPKAVVNAFADIAEGGQDDVQSMSRSKFDLHSEYVLRGIRHTPNTTVQKSAAAQALQKYGDMNAAVFLRGATDLKKSLAFMAHHEWSEERGPQEKYIAVPLKGVRSKSFRTSKGRTRKRWKPENLLRRFRHGGSVYRNKTTHTASAIGSRRRRKLPGYAFLIESRRGDPMIVRRRSKGGDLEFFYVLKPKAHIKKIWGFVGGV